MSTEYYSSEHLNTTRDFLREDLMMAVLGLVAGSIIEAIMSRLDAFAQSNQWFKWFLGLIQFGLIALTLYFFATKYMPIGKEFQSTYAGLFFVALFFNSQSGLVYRAQMPFNLVSRWIQGL